MKHIGRLLFFTLSLVLAGQANSHEMPGGLLIHLPFDGSLANHGSMPASAQLIIAGGEPAGRSPEFREGRFGKAMYFPGDVAVRIPVDIGHELYPEITLTAWVYLEDSASGYVITNRSASGPSIRVSGSYVAAIGPRVEFNENVGTGRWTFVAGVWDRNTSTLRFHYGRRSGTRDMTDRKVAGQISTWVGAWDDTLQSVLTNALVDDVRVYDSALTPEQIEGLWLGTEVAASKTQSITSDEMVVRKKPGRTVTDGDQLQSGELSQPGPVQPGLTPTGMDSGSLEEAEQIQRLREQGGRELGSNSNTGSTGTLSGQTLSTSEIAESVDSQVDATGSALASGSSALERTMREGGDAAESETGTGTRAEDSQRGEAETTTDWYLVNERLPSAISGHGGNIVESVYSAFHERGIHKIEIYENRDAPCAFVIRADDDNPTRRDGASHCENNSLTSPSVEAGIGLANITALAVCTNNRDNKRVKGVEIRGYYIRPDLSLHDFQMDSDEANNCAVWHPLVMCDAGYAANGITGHFNYREGKSSELVGLSLSCARIANF